MRWQWIALGCAVGFLFAESVGRVAAAVIPFAAAYLAARFVRPLGVRLAKLARMKEVPFCAVYAVLVLFGAGYALTVLSGRLLTELWQLIGRLPDAAEDIAELLTGLVHLLPFAASEERLGQFYGIVSHALEEAAAFVGNKGAELLGQAVQSIGGGVMSVFMGAVAFVYLTADLPGASKCVRALLPEKWKPKLSAWMGETSSVVFSYIRACFTLCLVTTVELSAGLTLIGAENPLAAAVITAVVDALPVFGCSAVLVPWAAWKFLSGNAAMGAGLLVLLAVTYAVRQFLEPRLVGKVTGVHPAVALLAVYVGWKTAGLPGMIAAPVILAGVGQREERTAEKNAAVMRNA
ncbi:MAG: AI-2E family transporter [Clostridia bacterium]|nr:AI-2E family transporter [Clostridia bacterium]